MSNGKNIDMDKLLGNFPNVRKPISQHSTQNIIDEFPSIEELTTLKTVPALLPEEEKERKRQERIIFEDYQKAKWEKPQEIVSEIGKKAFETLSTVAGGTSTGVAGLLRLIEELPKKLSPQFKEYEYWQKEKEKLKKEELEKPKPGLKEYSKGHKIKFYMTQEELEKAKTKEEKKPKPHLIGTKDGKDIWELPSGDTFSREKGQDPGIPWDELDYETQLNDMRSLAIWGKLGTSEGDAWPQHLIDAAKEIVGNAPDITSEHIKKFIDYMYKTGSLSYMQTHEGKKAYTPDMFPGRKPTIGEQISKPIIDLFQKSGEQVKAMGLPPGSFEEMVFSAAGESLPAITAMAHMGPAGLPILSAAQFSSQLGKKGVPIGATHGAMLHKMIKAANLFPRSIRVPLLFSFGFSTSQGETMKERFADGFFWAGLGAVGGEGLPKSEIKAMYRDVAVKPKETIKAFFKKNKVDITDKEAEEFGGWDKLADDVGKVIKTHDKEIVEAEAKMVEAETIFSKEGTIGVVRKGEAEKIIGELNKEFPEAKIGVYPTETRVTPNVLENVETIRNRIFETSKDIEDVLGKFKMPEITPEELKAGRKYFKEEKISEPKTMPEEVPREPTTLPERVPPSDFTTREVEGVGKVRLLKRVVTGWPKAVPKAWYDVYEATSGKMIAPNKDAMAEWRNLPNQLKNSKSGMLYDEVADILKRDFNELHKELTSGRKILTEGEKAIEKGEFFEREAEEYLTNEIDKAYSDVVSNFRREKQAGFIKIGKDKPQVIKDVEVRKVLNKSLLPIEAKQKIRFSLKDRAEDVKRLLVYEPTLKEHPEFKNDIRKFQDIPLDAKVEADKTVIGTIGKLNKVDYDRFREEIGLKSMEYELKQNRSVPGDLTLEQVQKALLELESIKTKPIEEALKKHDYFTRLIGEELVKRRKLDKEDLKDFYFPHRVLDYTPTWANWTGMPKRFSRPYRSYTLKRKGTPRSLDFDYVGNMSNYYQKVLLDNAIEDFMEKSAEKYNKFDKITKEQRESHFGKEKPKPGSLYEIDGEQYKGFQFIKGNIFYPTETINENLWHKGIVEGWTLGEFETAVGPKGGKAVREALAMGGKHKTYLLPREIAERLERFRVPAGDLPLFWNIRNLTSTWKRVTLDFAGLPFQINNFFGDGINLYKTDPAAFEKVRNSFPLVLKQLYKPQSLTVKEKAFLKLAREQRVSTTHFFREMGIDIEAQQILKRFKNNYNPFNWPGEILRQIEKVSVGREEVLRLAKFMKDLERIANGESVVSGEIDIKGLPQLDAAGKTARTFTVDYGAVPPAYRRFLRGFLCPFMTFHDYNARNWAKYSVKKPGNLALKFIIPSVAIFAWNNAGKRKEIEENLPDWLKWLPHINTGYKTKEGKDIVIGLQTPFDMAASWIGLDMLPAKITAVRAGKMTLKEAALKQLKDTGLGSPRVIMRILNPVIQIMQGLLKNKDPYTGMTVVPERFKGTEQEKKFIAQYIISGVFTPYMQYVRAGRDLELSPHVGRWGAWLLKGPLDLKRALGIREVDLDISKMVEGYGEKEKLNNIVKNKLAFLELHWIKSNKIGMTNPEKAQKYWDENRDKVLKREGPTPTNEQIFNRIYSLRIMMELCREQIKKAKTKEEREYFLDLLKSLKKAKYIESMYKFSQKSIRPELLPKALPWLLEGKKE